MPSFWILMLVLMIGADRSAAQTRSAQQQLSRADRIRIGEAFRLVDELGDSIWPGLGRTPMPMLLVTDSVEFLVGHYQSGIGFGRPRQDPMIGRTVAFRPRQFSPTLLATFPVDGVPTIVIGTPERTEKSSTAWVLTVLHEHFHQWQYSQPGYYEGVARLDLADGDTTGMWMLNYPFPYDAVPVGQAVRRWALALRSALNPSNERCQRVENLVNARDALGQMLSPADHRYLEFQLWQEGVARYIEYRAAELASRQGEPDPEFRNLADYQPYRTAAVNARRTLLAELEGMDLAKNQRVSFYPIGAAIALLLDEIRPRWKQAYSERRFSLGALLHLRAEACPCPAPR